MPLWICYATANFMPPKSQLGTKPNSFPRIVKKRRCGRHLNILICCTNCWRHKIRWQHAAKAIYRKLIAFHIESYCSEKVYSAALIKAAMERDIEAMRSGVLLEVSFGKKNKLYKPKCLSLYRNIRNHQIFGVSFWSTITFNPVLNASHF